MYQKLIRTLNSGDSFVVKSPLDFSDEDISDEDTLKELKKLEGKTVKIREVINFSYMPNRYYVDDPFVEISSNGNKKAYHYLLIGSDIDIQKTNLLLMKESMDTELEKINPKNKLPFL